MKSTLLGMIGEPFRFREHKDENGDAYRTIDNNYFELAFSDAFKFSDGPDGPERAGEHVWFATIDKDIYPKEIYRAFTDARTSKKVNDIRTWAGTSKASGEKHVQIPVIYLSLKRLVPIGEEKKIKHTPANLTIKEKEFFEKYHRRILLIDQQMKSAEYVESQNKATLGFATDEYNSLANSAGQDNIGKVLLAILSFKRLKERMRDEYKGGLLLIDEVDATLYPAAQVQLLRALLRFANDLNLQIVFTTHSPELLRTMDDEVYQKDCKLLFLETRDSETAIYEKLPIGRAIAHLCGETVAPEAMRKIGVFSEDSSTRIFLKGLLPAKLKKSLDIKNISLGEGELNNLRKAGLRDFKESVIVYDGDIDVKRPAYKSSNSVALPGGAAPEVVFYRFLRELDERDDFWDRLPGGYTKQVCFLDYSHIDEPSVLEAKKWFGREKDANRFGRGCSKLINRWIGAHSAEKKKFVDSFISAYESVGGKYSDSN